MSTKVNPMANLVLLVTLVAAALVGAKIDTKMLSDRRHQGGINNEAVLRIPNNPTSQPKTLGIQQRLALATVRKGGGVESPLIRQLMAEPGLVVDNLANRKIGLSPFQGDTGDKAALKQWAGQQAHLFAIGRYYVDLQSGIEVRVKQVGAVYLLRASADGTLSVDKYPPAPSGGGQVSGPAHTNELASSIAHAQFTDWSDDLIPRQLPAYEYLQKVAG